MEEDLSEVIRVMMAIDKLQRQGTMSIEPSAVSYSPYNYVYFYLTDDKYEGPHIIISNGEEWGEKGIMVGLHHHYENPHEDDVTVTKESLVEALEYAAELAGAKTTPSQ